MKPPNDRVWNWSQTIDYFLPVTFVAIVMLIVSVPAWIIWAFGVSTCLWATYKYGQ